MASLAATYRDTAEVDPSIFGDPVHERGLRLFSPPIIKRDDGKVTLTTYRIIYNVLGETIIHRVGRPEFPDEDLPTIARVRNGPWIATIHSTAIDVTTVPDSSYIVDLTAEPSHITCTPDGDLRYVAVPPNVAAEIDRIVLALGIEKIGASCTPYHHRPRCFCGFNLPPPEGCLSRRTSIGVDNEKERYLDRRPYCGSRDQYDDYQESIYQQYLENDDAWDSTRFNTPTDSCSPETQHAVWVDLPDGLYRRTMQRREQARALRARE